MADRISKEQRSRNMAAIKSGNTKPEMVVRSLLYRLGYPFRLHRKDLPGKPDIVLPKYHTVIFIHGCFWHRHKNCRNASTPKTNTKFWEKKFNDNIKRDKAVRKKLSDMGWLVFTIWECETKDHSELETKIKSFFSSR